MRVENLLDCRKGTAVRQFASGGLEPKKSLHLILISAPEQRYIFTRDSKLPRSAAGRPVASPSFVELSMKAAVIPFHSTDWRSLYRAAILEQDRTAVPRRVSEAEKAVVARGREIFYSNSSPEEKEALEDALYALRAYRTAWQHTEAA